MLNKQEILNNFKEIIKNVVKFKPELFPEYEKAYYQLKNILKAVENV